MSPASKLAVVLLIALSGAACAREEAPKPPPAPSAPTGPPAATAPSAPTGPLESSQPPVRRRGELPKSGAGSIKGDCAVNTCPTGQECVLIEVHCIRAPCPPQPECVLP